MCFLVELFFLVDFYIKPGPAAIALELKNLEHENITVIVSSRWAKLDFTWLVNKTVEKTWYSKILMYCF